MFTVLIPARYASTRLPGKPLADIAGKPMLAWVAERAAESGAAEVVIATDHADIADAMAALGWRVCTTSSAHPTGTDRLAEVAAGLRDEIVCNVQGDEPLVEIETIAALVAPLVADPNLMMGTLKTPLDRPEDRYDPTFV